MNRHAALDAMQEVDSKWREQCGDLLEIVKQFPAIALIAAERTRQVEEEGWTPDHDDMYDEEHLARAAVCYAMPKEIRYSSFYGLLRVIWPFQWIWWKPSPDNRIRELVKAGALIAAEIERLQRSEKSKTAPATDTGKK